MPDTKSKRENEDEDEDEEEEEEEEEMKKPQYLVCPKCGYSIKLKAHHEKKKIMCEKCGARMVKSTKKGKVSMKDMLDDISTICREIKGE